MVVVWVFGYRLARRPKLTDRIWISASWACRARCCAAAARKTTAMGVAHYRYGRVELPFLMFNHYGKKTTAKWEDDFSSIYYMLIKLQGHRYVCVVFSLVVMA